MRNRSLWVAAIFVGISMANLPSASGMPRQEPVAQVQTPDAFKKALEGETSDAGRFTVLRKAMQEATTYQLREKVLAAALPFHGPELDAFLADVARDGQEAVLRSYAAVCLGRLGSEKSLPVLVSIARSGRITDTHDGKPVAPSGAQGGAMFAIVRLAERFPDLTEEAVASLRALSYANDPNDIEHLPDVRNQALYCLTKDPTLLQAFYTRLKSADENERTRGMYAFMHLKLKEAPSEVVQMLQDPSTRVRTDAVVVLTNIGDKKNIPAFMQIAGNTQEERLVRTSALMGLGLLHADSAKELLEGLLAEPDSSIRQHASIALYLITGKRYRYLPANVK